MPRPIKFRRITFEPEITYFKPWGVPTIELEEVTLTKGELEAIRLADLENMDQGSAAKKMNVSQPTFSRILDSARSKIADALVNGKALRIEGGRYRVVRRHGSRRTGPRGMGMGRRRRFGRGRR